MAILDFDAHDKHLGLMMTLAGGGFAYTDSQYNAGDTFFGWTSAGAYPATIVLSIALVAFLVALASGVFALFGMSGISQYNAHKAALNDIIELETNKRFASGGTRSDAEESATKSLAKTNALIERSAQRLFINSKIQLLSFLIAFSLCALLFVDSKVDPNKAAPECELKVNQFGKIVVPVECAPIAKPVSAQDE